MKKLVTIIIILILALPQQGFSLRPQATVCGIKPEIRPKEIFSLKALPRQLRSLAAWLEGAARRMFDSGDVDSRRINNTVSGLNELLHASDELSSLIRRQAQREIREVYISVRIKERVYYLDTDEKLLRVVDLTQIQDIENPNLKIHISIYRANPKANYIVQSKPPVIMNILAEGKQLPHMSPDSVAVLKQITPPRLIDAAPSNLATAVSAELSVNNCAMTKQSGIFTIGVNADEALFRLLIIEDSAKTFWTADVMQGLKRIFAELISMTFPQIKKIDAASFERYRREQLAGETQQSEKKKTRTKKIPIISYEDYDNEEIEVLRRELAETAKKNAEEGLVVGPGGNISAITADRKIMLIKASGRTGLKPEDYVAVHVETGRVIAQLGIQKPSTEMIVHLYVYRECPDVWAMVHSHNPVATGIASAQMVYTFLGKLLPRIGYVHPGGIPFARAVARKIKNSDQLLISKHGIVSVSRSRKSPLKEALKNAIDMEKTAQALFNDAIFRQRLKDYYDAKLKYLKKLREIQEDPALTEHDKLPLENLSLFMAEQVVLESSKRKIKSRADLKEGEILWDIRSYDIFEYRKGSPLDYEDPKSVERAMRRGLIVVLEPLSLSIVDRARRNLLIKQLDSKDEDKRDAALEELKLMERQGIIPKPYKTNHTFLHCHTTYSFSPYTPTSYIWRGYQLGIHKLGIVDHDTVKGFREALRAGLTVGVNVTCGYEMRTVAKGTDLMKVDINFPKMPGYIYIAAHGVYVDENEMTERSEASKIRRFRRMIERLNKLNNIGIRLELDYDRDIAPLTEKGNPTERHVSEAIARKIYKLCNGNIDAIIETTQKLIRDCGRPDSDIKPFTEKQKKDASNIDDFLVLIRDYVIKKESLLDPPDEEETPPITDFVDYAHLQGSLAVALYLGGADAKRCEAEKKENLDKLIDYYDAILCDGIGFMSNRNTPSEIDDFSKRAKSSSRRHVNRYLPNGMDVNKPFMPFTYRGYTCRPDLVAEAISIFNREMRQRRVREARVYPTIWPDEFVIAPSVSGIEPAYRVDKAIEAVNAGIEEGIKTVVHLEVVRSANDILGLSPDEAAEIEEKTKHRAIRDVHIMAMDDFITDEFLMGYIEKGKADIITLHWEGYTDKKRLLERIRFIRGKGVMAGLAIRPDTDIEAPAKFIMEHKNEIDMVLFDVNSLKDIQRLRNEYGYIGPVEAYGVDKGNIAKAAKAGANVFVAGSAVYKDGISVRDALGILYDELGDARDVVPPAKAIQDKEFEFKVEMPQAMLEDIGYCQGLVSDMDNRVLITGGAGYVGSELARYLLEKQKEVWILDDESTGHEAAVPAEVKDRLHYIKGDICDTELIRWILESNGIGVVYHAAAKTLMGDSVFQPALYNYTNVIGTLSVAEAIMFCQQKHPDAKIKLVNISTCGVYDDSAEEVSRGEGFSEKTSVRPTAPYTETKLMAEKVLEEYYKKFGIEYAVIRPFNIVGASKDGQWGEDTGHATHLITVIGDYIRGKRKNVQIFGNDWETSAVPDEAKLTGERLAALGIEGAKEDRTNIREYIHVNDFCKIISAIGDELAACVRRGERPQSRIYNGATGVPLSTLNVTAHTLEQAKALGMLKEKPKVVIAKRRPGDDAVKMAAKDRYSKLAGTPIEETVRTHLAFLLKRPNGYGDDKSGYRDLSEEEALPLLLDALSRARHISYSIKREIMYRLMTDLVIAAINTDNRLADADARKEQIRTMQTVRGNILRDAKTLDLALRNRALQHVFWQTIKTADNIEMLNLAWRVSKRLGTDSISAKLSNRISELIRLKFPKAAAAHLKALERNTYMPISTAA